MSDTDEHKLAKQWGSSMYAYANVYLRTVHIETLRATLPNTLYFAQGFLRYFESHAKSPEELLALGITTLYSGIGDKLAGDSLPFVATSHKNDFAHNCGTVFAIPVESLEASCKSVCLENEVTLMPGTITVHRRSLEKNVLMCSCTFKEDTEWMEDLTAVPVPLSTPSGQTMRLDFRGKIAVWFRAIRGRPIDIFVVEKMPSTHDDVRRYMFQNAAAYRRSFYGRMFFVPDVIDIQRELTQTPLTPRKLKILMRRYNEQMAHMAVYDPNTKLIETLHAGVPSSLFYEHFDESLETDLRKQLVDQIHASNWLNTLVVAKPFK